MISVSLYVGAGNGPWYEQDEAGTAVEDEADMGAEVADDVATGERVDDDDDDDVEDAAVGAADDGVNVGGALLDE